MAEETLRLPARPSLEQLRKQAKELHRSAGSGSLADAQLALARRYGFAGWPALVHHVERLQSAGRLEMFERLATDILAGYQGDAAALERVGRHFGDSYTRETLRRKLRERLQGLVTPAGDPTLDDIRFVLARQYGFDSWPALAEGLAQPPARGGAAPLGLSSAPPFYRIDAERRTIQVHPPLTDADWDTVFAIMEERGLTGFQSSAVTDSALERLAQLPIVTSVNIGGARAISDDGVLHLANMPQLEELEMGGWHCPLTDRALEVLRHLRRLRTASLGWAQHFTDAGAANLTFCDQIENVNLMGTPSGDGAINALRGKKSLKQFKTGRQVTDAGIPLLHDFPVFKTWQGEEVEYGLMSFEGKPNSLMIDGPFTNAGLARLAGLDGLFSLGFFWHSKAFTSAGLAGLESLANLGFLGCQDDKCDDEAMRHIARIPKLRMLMAQGAVASDDGFVALSASPTLEHIWGRECPNLQGRGFAALANMPELKGLAVSCQRVGDDALATLPSFPSLRFLMPMDVPDAGFRHVGRCRRLQKLWCMYCRDTGDEATGHLADLRLELYYAGKTRITDRSLEILGAMTSLEELEFWEVAAITDAGVAALAKLPHLRKISVENSPHVTRAGLSVFPARVSVRT